MRHYPNSLEGWLTQLEQLHPKTIDLGLERVRQVCERMEIRFTCPVITVGGTNGKGSTCAMLEAVLLQAGYRTGLSTSPHLIHFNERVRICGKEVSDDVLIQYFIMVEESRGDISLTYFEFTTLVFLKLFDESKLDAIILEVGLGGRLDAANIIDSDVAIVTNIGIDHEEYLGNTRESIGFEKAGIFRKGKVAICGDPLPPESMVAHAAEIGADLWLFGRDFKHATYNQHRFYVDLHYCIELEHIGLRGVNQLQNASVVLAALQALRHRLPVSEQQLHEGLSRVNLPGRFQVITSNPTVILDVAHNPHAAEALARNLDELGLYSSTYAVFGAMEDKDIDGIIAPMIDRIDHWCVADLPLSRGAKGACIKARLLASAQVQSKPYRDISIDTFLSPIDAFINAQSRAGANDRIVVFGSFLMVACVRVAVEDLKLQQVDDAKRKPYQASRSTELEA